MPKFPLMLLKRMRARLPAKLVMAALSLLIAHQSVIAKRLPEPASADDALLAARDAVRNGDADSAALLAQRMAAFDPRHVLLAYPEYWTLSLRLKTTPVTVDDASIRSFIERNEGGVTADLMRRDWLLALGKRGDFASFDAVYPKFALNDDAQVSCYALLSRYLSLTVSQAANAVSPENANAVAALMPTVMSAIRTALAAPRNIEGDGCGSLARTLAVQGRFTTDEIWSWIRLASDANLSGAIRKYGELLPERSGPEESFLNSIFDKPVLWLAKLGDPLQEHPQRIVLALARMARNDPEKTAALFERTWAARLQPDDRAYIWAQLGAAAAKKQMVEATEWSRKSLPLQGLSEDILTWQTRAALRAADWRLVHALIDKMPPDMRRGNDGAWIYWLGRALKFEGKLDEAKAQWASIAGQYHFYGLLAAEELGQTLTLPLRAAPITEAEVAAVKDLPGFVRAFKFYQLDMRANGNLEWNFTLRNMSDRELLAAAQWAQQNAVLDRAVNTADRTRNEHDFNLRYLTPFSQAMQVRADAVGLDVAWVYGLIRQESRFVMVARSSTGAAGLMQLMPATARYVAKKIGMSDYRPDSIHDLGTNLTLGTNYLRMVLDSVDDLPVLATAGYNAGPGRPRAWRATLIRPVEGAVFAETIPFNETRDYVKKVMSNAVYYGLLNGKPQSLKARMGIVAPKGYVESDLP